jgi:hypothetical protein
VGCATVPPAKPQKAPTKATVAENPIPNTSQSTDVEAESVAAARIAVRRVTISKPTSAVTAPSSRRLDTPPPTPPQSDHRVVRGEQDRRKQRDRSVVVAMPVAPSHHQDAADHARGVDPQAAEPTRRSSPPQPDPQPAPPAHPSFHPQHSQAAKGPGQLGPSRRDLIELRSIG